MSPALGLGGAGADDGADGGFALHFVTRRRRALALASPVLTAEGLQIPVNAIYTQAGGLLSGKQHNSLHPELTIGHRGIHFRAMTRRAWAIADIAHVETRVCASGWKLVFVSRRGGSALVADILGEANVLAALRALPDAVVLTPQAALLRNGSAAAGVEGLRLYQGPMW